MKAAWLFALLVAFTCSSAFATSIEGPGEIIPVEPYSFDGDQPTNVAVFMNQLPWGSNAVVEVLVTYGISHTVYNSASMGNISLDPFDKVIIASNQDDGFYYTLEDNRAWFEDYMAGGGCILFCCAAYFGVAGEYITWPGGFGHYSIDCINSVNIETPAHPVFNDPLYVSSGDLQGWNCSSHGSFDPMPDGAVVTITNVDFGYGTPTAFDFCWGAGGGYVIAQPIDWVGSYHPYTVNVVLYMCSEEPSPAESTTWGAIKSLYK